MSKAFTSESDDQNDIVMPPPLPPGIKNYMTPAGAARLAAEIKQLQDEKSRLNPQDVPEQARRDVLDAQLTYRVQRFEAVQVVDPRNQPRERVLFGARVTVSDATGEKETWRIVGIDEMDLAKGDISWTSPLATALLDKAVGDHVLFLKRRLTVLAIDYPDSH